MHVRSVVVGVVVLLSLSCGDTASDTVDLEAMTPVEREAYERRRAATRAASERVRSGSTSALAEAQRVADENARRRREARGIAAPPPAVRHRDDPTRWENPEPGIAAACSPVELGVRVCLGVSAEPKAVLMESSLPLLAGDTFTVMVGDGAFTARVTQGLGNVVWTGAEADRLIAALSAGSGAAAGGVIGPGGQAIVTDADGMEFRVSLRGASTAINRALR